MSVCRRHRGERLANPWVIRHEVTLYTILGCLAGAMRRARDVTSFEKTLGRGGILNSFGDGPGDGEPLRAHFQKWESKPGAGTRGRFP